MKASDPEGTRLPIKLDSTSSGEFVPVPLSRANHHANRLAHEQASANAKRLGLTRRSFLVSACGAARRTGALARGQGDLHPQVAAVRKTVVRAQPVHVAKRFPDVSFLIYRLDPHFRTYGPRTPRQFLNLLAWNGGARA